MVRATHRHVPIPENVAVYAKLTPVYMSIPAKLAEDYARIVAFQHEVGTARPA
jgi:gluconokinase